MRLNKRRVLILAAMVIVLAILGYGAAAYFTAETRTRNVITTGDISIDLLEWADDDRTVEFPAKGVKGVMPDASVTKIVEISNTSELNPAFVRVSLEKVIKLTKGADGTTDESLIELDINETDWTEKDGWYYYNDPLAPGATTEPLFTTVHFKPEMGNLYQGCTVNIIVSAQAVQVANNGSSAVEALGWPAAPEITE